jgi:hypothetical protein
MGFENEKALADWDWGEGLTNEKRYGKIIENERR